jgi:perosamine synthetase
MKNWKIPLFKILIEKEDIAFVSKVLERGMHWAEGPEIEEFENQLSQYVGRKYCVTFNSGTSALHGTLLALDVKKNDEIIVPSFTFISTVNSTLMVNATPKFVDIENDTFGIDPTLLESSITKKSKIILPIHYGGLPCKINEIKKICKKNNLFLVEDAAEALGSKIKNKMIGSFGDVSMFSFAGNKILTTGEGGAITTDSLKIANKLKLIRSHGRVTKNYFQNSEKPSYTQLGFNWRMSSITAALGLTQLNKLEKLISIRRYNAHFLNSHLKKIHTITIPNEPKNYKHVYQFYTILLPNQKTRDQLKKFLDSKRIMSKVFFYPVHLTNFYQKFIPKLKLVKTENISNRVLSLPLFPTMTKEELIFICDSINTFFEK